MAQTINADDGVISGSAGLKSSSDGTAILSLQTKGTTALTVDGSQNVGIGTSSPAYKLDVSGTGNFGGANPTLYIQPTTNTNNALMRCVNAGGTAYVGLDNNAAGLTANYALNLYHSGAYPINFSTNGTLRATIDSSGNLGLGVTPSAWQQNFKAYEIAGAGAAVTSNGSNRIEIGTGAYVGASSYLYTVTGTAVSRYSQQSGQHYWYIAPSGTAGDPITFTQAMTLDASGDLTLPGTLKLGNGVQTIAAANTNDLQLNAANGSGNILFRAAGAERARITSGGNVGINTTSPTRKLEVVDGSAQIRITDGTANTYWEFRSIFANTNQDLFIENNNGVAINCKADREVIIFGTTDNGAYNLQCNGTGVWGAGAYVNGSDARLKDNIQSLDSGLDVVKAMRPVTFQYKPEHSKDQSVQPGFIAQELQQAMAGKPYLDGVVQQGTEYLNVAYQNIIPILVKAIQELEAKVAALEAK